LEKGDVAEKLLLKAVLTWSGMIGREQEESEMNRRNILKFFSAIVFVVGSGVTATLSLFRVFYPGNARATKGPIGISLKDIKIDKYGRSLVKHPDNEDLSLASDDYVQDKWCPPEDPTKCTLKQCGCPAPDKQCNCAPPKPDQNCGCPPPKPNQNCGCPQPKPDTNCGCPLLICPCPKPPLPPWPVPDLVCPCK
jgi:hypothetical protein